MKLYLSIKRMLYCIVVSFYFLVVISCSFSASDEETPDNTIPDTTKPTISIKNLKDKDTVKSGFIVGRVEDDGTIDKVEVSLDNGPYDTATGKSNWKYKLPNGENSWKENSEHTIKVRAKDTAGNISNVVTLTVRKAKNTDVNGDGYADMVVGAEGYMKDTYREGRVYIFYSTGADGIIATSADRDADTIIDGSQGIHFGKKVILGDINGDGYADLVATNSGGSWGNEYNHQPKIYIFYSSGTEGIKANSLNQADNIIEDRYKFEYVSISIGDINGDGYMDLVTGLMNTWMIHHGFVYVYHSSGPNGIVVTSHTEADTMIRSDRPANMPDAFGCYISIGDINGDGFADLAVGDGDSRVGKAYLFHSSGTEGIKAEICTDANTIIEGGVSTVALGDVNGDGFDDLATGNTRKDKGVVYIFKSSGNEGIISTNDFSIIPIDTNHSDFGSSLSFGDLNGDGFDDLVVAANSSSTPDYYVLMYVFHSAGVNGIVTSIPYTTILTGSERYRAISVISDINGDGYKDLALNGPLSKVHIFHSLGSSGIRKDPKRITYFIEESDTTISGLYDSNYGYSFSF